MLTHRTPLFNQEMRKKADTVLVSVRNGWVSDSPGMAMYVKLGVDDEGLPHFRCLRGMNSVEGAVHMPLMRIFGSLNASVELADCVVSDYCERHNTNVSISYTFCHSLSLNRCRTPIYQVGHRNKTGRPYDGHHDP